VRGFALLARTAGVVAHLAEEMSQPLGMPLFRELDRRLAGEDA
jgi:citrate synthase